MLLNFISRPIRFKLAIWLNWEYSFFSYYYWYILLKFALYIYNNNNKSSSNTSNQLLFSMYSVCIHNVTIIPFTMFNVFVHKQQQQQKYIVYKLTTFKVNCYSNKNNIAVILALCSTISVYVTKLSNNVVIDNDGHH